MSINTITVAIPDDLLQRLNEIALWFCIAPEDLVRVSIQVLLIHPEEQFKQALERVLDKNKELYQQLA